MAVKEDLVFEALSRVKDPESGKDLIAMNRVKQIEIEGQTVRLGVELTTAAASVKEAVAREIEREVGRLDGVRKVDIEWTTKAREGGGGLPQLPGVKNAIAIGAGKGGVGKSTIAVLAALGLQRAGAAVGLLDADVYGPSIPKLLGVDMARPVVRDERFVPINADGLKVMSVGFLIGTEQAVIWRGPMVHGVVKQFLEQVDWGELDYLIIDLPPGTGDVPLTLSQTIPMTGAVVVCTPQEVALLDAVRALRMYQQLNVDIVGIVENMSYFVAPDTGKEYDLFGRGGARQTAQRLQVPLLGEIPINIAIRQAGDDGTPKANFDDTDPVTREAIASFVRNLADRVSQMNAAKAPPLELKIT